MKPLQHRINWKIAAGAILCLATTLAARTEAAVNTPPVGFITITIPAGRTQSVSMPLQNSPILNAAVSSLTASTITTLNAGWSTTAFGPYATNPCVLRFTSGTSKGRHFKVASNTTDTLTLNTAVDLTTVAVVN